MSYVKFVSADGEQSFRDTYLNVYVESRTGKRYRFVFDVEPDSIDEIRLYLENDDEPSLRHRL